jgi:hypothetical protein
MPAENTRPPQLHAAVERRLAAEGKQQGIGPFPDDDFFHELGRDRQKIDAVGHSFGGLDGGDVGIDQDDAEAFLLEGFDGLAARIVELARLPDLERSRPQKQDFAGLGQGSLSAKASNRKSVSFGPGAASGWN